MDIIPSFLSGENMVGGGTQKKISICQYPAHEISAVKLGFGCKYHHLITWRFMASNNVHIDFKCNVPRSVAQIYNLQLMACKDALLPHLPPDLPSAHHSPGIKASSHCMDFLLPWFTESFLLCFYHLFLSADGDALEIHCLSCGGHRCIVRTIWDFELW